MIILGAGGHAKEFLELILDDYSKSDLAFFDNVTTIDKIPDIFKNYELVRTIDDLTKWFDRRGSEYVMGIGGIKEQEILRKIATQAGGSAKTVIAKNAVIGNYNIHIGLGTTIMQLAFISNCVTIGRGVLINTRANIHHDVKINDYTEIGPNALILGHVTIGKKVSIGAGAIILPHIKVGDNCIIGAGSVVTKNIEANSLVKGNPAR